MTDALRTLAAELDEWGNEAEELVPEIPDFRLTDVLGRGGMGTVYLAEQVSLGREVALKVVNCSAVGIADEARTIAQLHHPNIVQVYAAGTAQDQSWFAMELKRALEITETLATRYPDDETIKASVETLKKAREAHRLPSRPRHRRRLNFESRR